MTTEFKAGLMLAIEIAKRVSKAGPGGADITKGIPAEIYIGIGRGRYDGENGHYEVAEDTADAVRGETVVWLEHVIKAEEVPVFGDGVA